MLAAKVRMAASLLGWIAVVSVLDGCVVSGFSAGGSSTCAGQETIGSSCDDRNTARLSRGGKGDGGPENRGGENVARPGDGSDTGDDGEDTGDDQEL